MEKISWTDCVIHEEVLHRIAGKGTYYLKLKMGN